jgi:glycerol-3-phosphate acyltransferase PlsX
MKMVHEGTADAFVTAGNSGAVLVGGQIIVGRLKGVERPPFATVLPTEKGISLLLDCGANVDARPSHLVQFARMGSIYMEHVLGVHEPKVGIVNIGAESEKGNELVKSTYPLLEEMGKQGEINFTGSLEARDIPAGNVDIAICDGFVGNVILKMYEGSAKVLLSEIKGALLSSILSRIGALLIKPSLRSTLKKFDGSRYGGAPMLGLKGLVVKMHGSSGAVEVERAMEQCVQYYRQEIAEKITAYAAEEKARQDLQRKQEKAAAETEKSE